MSDRTSILEDPAFRQLLRTRSRWRWGLSGILIGAYLGYCLAGVCFPDAYARAFPGSSISWGIVGGYAMVFLSVALALLYIKVIGRLLEVPFERPGPRR